MAPNHIYYPIEALDRFQRDFCKLAANFDGNDVALHLTHKAGYPLALVEPKDVASRINLPWQWGDDVTICSPDGSRGLTATYNEGDSDEAFEIVSWS